MNVRCVTRILMQETILINNMKTIIWGRELQLDIIYQTFYGKPVIDNQLLTAEKIPSVDFNDSLSALKLYINKYHASYLESETIDNIFKYVAPKSLFIVRDQEKRIFAVMCNYKFDIEHGIAIIYENERFKEVGPQDIIL